MTNELHTTVKTAGGTAASSFAQKHLKNQYKDALALKFLETNHLLKKFLNTLVPSSLHEHHDRNKVNETFHKKATEIVEAWNDDLNQIKLKSQKLEEKIECLKPTEFEGNNSITMFQKIASQFSKSNHAISKRHENELDELNDIFKAEARSVQNDYYRVQTEEHNQMAHNCSKSRK